MRTIILQHTNRGDFVSSYLGEFPDGGVFVQTTDLFKVGERVKVQMVFPDIPEGITIEGKVCWRRLPTPWRSALQPGIGIAFNAAERNKTDFVLSFCNGRSTPLRKTEKRIPVDMKVEVLADKRRIPCRARDISRGGVSMISSEIFGTGDFIEFDIYIAADKPPERLAGYVVWCNPNGDGSGVGVKFEFPTPFRQKRIQHLVNQLDGTIKTGRFVSSIGIVRV